MEEILYSLFNTESNIRKIHQILTNTMDGNGGKVYIFSGASSTFFLDLLSQVFKNMSVSCNNLENRDDLVFVRLNSDEIKNETVTFPSTISIFTSDLSAIRYNYYVNGVKRKDIVEFIPVVGSNQWKITEQLVADIKKWIISYN